MSFREYLTEMSQEIDDFHTMSSNKNIAAFKLAFTDAKIKDAYTDGNDDIVIVTNHFKATEFYFYFVKDGEPIAGAYFEQTGVHVNGKEHYGYIAKFTINWGADRGFMYKAYRAFSKYMYNAYIVSGAKQTQYSKKNWLNWYKTKRNIKEIFSYDYEEGKVIELGDVADSWSKSPNSTRYRLVVKFN